jgi:IS30 family transposase
MKRKWTDEEIEYVKENVGSSKITTIARNLNRTLSSVELKMKRLGLSNTKSFTGQFTRHELALQLKVDPNSIKLWIDQHGLKCTKKVTRNTKVFHFIKPEDFWIWSYQNKERVDFSKIERHTILPEPDWVEQERQNIREVNYKKWTTKEVLMMSELISMGSTFSDIGKKLNRSTISIQRKYQRIQHADNYSS